MARNFADWVKNRTDRLSDAQMQAMLRNEHGGMNEALANLYARTGDLKYLKLAERFNHKAVLGPAAERRHADRIAREHPDSQVHRHRAGVRDERQAAASNCLALLLEHRRQ